MFVLYSLLTGVTLSYILLVYTQQSIVATLLITAGTFGAMSVYGFTTKNDLSSYGSLFFMGIMGLIIASLVNYFLQSTMLHWIISCFGVLIFVGLTAYDTQKIKALLGQPDTEMNQKLAILGALTLYLDFINLFIYLLQLFGRKK
jgi:FtsH-binding integral membrane protein